MKHLYFLILFVLPMLGFGQFVYDINFANVKFGGPGVTITNKVGSGTSAGSVVLYQNVVSVGGQKIDAIVRTLSLSSGATMIFDVAGTGTGYTNNNPTWFSPQFDFPKGGGSALFNFEFILGGSYNNATKTGTAVTLQDVMINSYDIDGNGEKNSNQFSEFGGFFTSEMATATNITTTYNSASNLTKFNSNIDDNVVDASDPKTRVRVTYQNLSNFQIAVGAAGEGTAYFFIDFDAGPAFGIPTKILTAPNPDLNTTTPGNDNAATFCSAAVPFTAGGTNIPSLSTTPSAGTTLERLKVTFTTSEVKDGSAEKIQINNATSGSSIALNFGNAASISNIVLSGTTYTVTTTVSGGESSLTFNKKNSATMTMAEGEKLLDAFYYNNTASTATPGIRIFDIRVKDGAYESDDVNFTVTVGSIPTITQQAQNASISSDGNTSFKVTANASSYQWQVDPGTGVFANVTNSAIYSGATTNQLTLTKVPFAMDNYKFRAITSSATCSRNSNNAQLTVLLILPVKWGNFSGLVKDKKIQLNWNTTSELQTKNFIIEASTDGIHFSQVGSVDARGNSSVAVNYNFLHEHPAAGNNFYRLLQVDINGRSDISKVIMVSFGESFSLQVLANPVSNGQLAFQVSKPSTLFLYNSIGNLVHKEQVSGGFHSINVSAYAKGMYTLIAGTEARKLLLN